MRTIHYYYSVRSSFAYLGAAELVAIARRHGARIAHRPIRLAVTMPPIGGRPFDERPPQQRAYSRRDCIRWAEHRGLPFVYEPVHHEGPMELPSGIIIAAQRVRDAGGAGDIDELSRSVLAALWAEDRDIANEGVITELAARAGFAEPKGLAARATEPDIQAELARNNREAIMRGVVGAPTYFVGEENFYGQDRLDFVDRWLARSARPGIAS